MSASGATRSLDGAAGVLEAAIAAAPVWDRALIGPRRPGMVCRLEGALTYRVDAVLVGVQARALISWSDVAIVETDLDGTEPGRRRTHCTMWDPGQDVVLDSPYVLGSRCPFCGLAAVGSEFRARFGELRVWHGRTRCAEAPVDRTGRPTAMAELMKPCGDAS